MIVSTEAGPDNVNPGRRWWYFTCRCGVCGPLRDDRHAASRDGMKHHAAKRAAFVPDLAADLTDFSLREQA